MASIKISQLPSATTPLSGTEEVPIVQGGQTVKVAASSFGGSTTPNLQQVLDIGHIADKKGIELTNSDYGQYGSLFPSTLGFSWTNMYQIEFGNTNSDYGIYSNSNFLAGNNVSFDISFQYGFINYGYDFSKIKIDLYQAQGFTIFKDEVENGLKLNFTSNYFLLGQFNGDTGNRTYLEINDLLKFISTRYQASETGFKLDFVSTKYFFKGDYVVGNEFGIDDSSNALWVAGAIEDSNPHLTPSGYLRINAAGVTKYIPMYQD